MKFTIFSALMIGYGYEKNRFTSLLLKKKLVNFSVIIIYLF